jgi:CelD/BcsL family acetyltransferase involved in cellulose biosynthesis
VTLSTPGQWERAAADVIAIEQKSWKQQEGLSIAARDGELGFYGELARRCAERGSLRTHVLYLDGRPAAHVLAVLFRGQLLALKTSYDQTLSTLSPGIAVVLHALRDAFEQGLSAVDFLGQGSRWKDEVATDLNHKTATCVYTTNYLECRGCTFVHSRVKPFAKRRAPGLLAGLAKGAQWLRTRRREGGSAAPASGGGPQARG